jgi:AcrR family transcriptional regulator
VSTVLRSTLQVLARSGYARLRVEDVAAAAGVNKTTIYRRWPTRADLVADAIGRLSLRPTAVWTGHLERDLVAALLGATALWGAPAGRGISRVLVAERSDHEVERIVSSVRDRNRAAVIEVLEHARRAGDLRSRRDLRLVADLLLGATYSRLRESNRRLDPQWVTAMVRLVLNGARSASSERPKRTSFA